MVDFIEILEKAGKHGILILLQIEHHKDWLQDIYESYHDFTIWLCDHYVFINIVNGYGIDFKGPSVEVSDTMKEVIQTVVLNQIWLQRNVVR